jgi:hypothetical protein
MSSHYTEEERKIIAKRAVNMLLVFLGFFIVIIIQGNANRDFGLTGGIAISYLLCRAGWIYYRNYGCFPYPWSEDKKPLNKEKP